MRGTWWGETYAADVAQADPGDAFVGHCGGWVCGEKREIGRDGWIVGIVVRLDSEAWGKKLD